MRRFVEEEATGQAGVPHRQASLRAAELQADDLTHFAHLTSRDHRLCFAHGAREEEVVGDAEQALGGLRRFDHAACLGHGHRHRLLGEDVATVLEGLNGELSVRPGRGTDRDEVQALGEELIRVVVGAGDAEAPGGVAGPVQVAVQDGDDLDVFEALVAGNVARGGHPARADDEHVQGHRERVVPAGATDTMFVEQWRAASDRGPFSSVTARFRGHPLPERGREHRGVRAARAVGSG